MSIPILDTTTKGFRLVNKPISELATHAFDIVLFEPNLQMFSQHLQNRYSQLLSKSVDGRDNFITLDTFIAHAESVLLTELHLVNRPLYARVDAKHKITDSSSKVLASAIGRETPVDRWLIDICREVARPMARNKTLYVPFIEHGKHRGSRPLPYFGLTTGASAFICETYRGYFNLIGLDFDSNSRTMCEEDLTVAPLTVSDGAYFFADPEMATWRYKASMSLMTFINGAKTWKQDDPRLSITVDDDLPILSPSRIITAEHKYVPSYDNIPWPDALDLKLSTLDQYDNVMQGKPVQLLNEQRIVLYWTTNRSTTYASWFQTAKTINSSLPPLDEHKELTSACLHLATRYPTEEAHSKTPKSTGASQGTITVPRVPGRKRKRGKKAKAKGKKENTKAKVDDEPEKVDEPE